jgi:hypothetical protein
VTETINLDQTHLSVANRLAEKRHDSFSHDSYEDTAMGKSSFEVHLIGAKAEIAFSMKYGVLVDLEERLEGDDFDFEVLYQDRPVKIDVKATTYRPAWLQVRESKTNSDYYVATYVEDADATSVELVGWASRETVLDGDYIDSPGGGRHRNYRLWKDEMDQLPKPNLMKEMERKVTAIKS